jgi:predicted DCC family thiol-disulfide oxidoreductase YuxK
MVNFAIKWNKKNNLRFAPLQSAIGAELINKMGITKGVDSVIFIEADKFSIYSGAALKICWHLSFPFNILYLLIVIPSFARNLVYKWIAANRYKWFGKKETCMIPSKEVKMKFLN